MDNPDALAAFIREKHALGISRDEIVSGVAEHGGDAALVDRVLDEQRVALEQAKKDEELIHRHLLSQQSLTGALVAGGITAAAGAAVWAGIAYVTEYQIGWIAIILGCVVAWSVRRFGHGLDARFRCIGLLAALSGIFFGNAFTAVLFFSRELQAPLLESARLLGDMQFYSLIVESSTVMDGVFYLIAAVCGWQGSCIVVNDQTLAEHAKREEAARRA